MEKLLFWSNYSSNLIIAFNVKNYLELLQNGAHRYNINTIRTLNSCSHALLIHFWLIPASHYTQSLHPNGAIFITILMVDFECVSSEIWLMKRPLTISSFKHNNVTCSTGKKGFKWYIIYAVLIFPHLVHTISLSALPFVLFLLECVKSETSNQTLSIKTSIFF